MRLPAVETSGSAWEIPESRMLLQGRSYSSPLLSSAGCGVGSGVRLGELLRLGQPTSAAILGGLLSPFPAIYWTPARW